MPDGVETMDEYLASLPEDRRRPLEEIRRVVEEEAPGAEECISYGMHAFRFEGRVLLAFAARAGHLALYPMSGGITGEFAEELAGFDTSRGTIRFQPARPLPPELVGRIVRARIEANRSLEKGRGRQA